MPERGVFRFALAGFDLQSRLDHIAGCGQVGGGHASDGAGGQELEYAEFLVRAFAEHAPFEMIVGGEVNGGEGHVAEEAGRGAFVEAD